MKLRNLFAVALMLGASAIAKAQEPADSASVAAATSLAAFVGQNISALESRGIKIDPEVFLSTFEKAMKGEDTGISPDEANYYISSLLSASMPQPQQNSLMADTVAEQKFLAEAAEAKGAITLPSGTVMQTITEGTGPTPSKTDIVKVRYVGKLSDGTVFDDELEEPVEFEAGRLIPGFTDGLTHMRQGGTYRIIIPASQGYGSRGVEGVIPGNSALDFTITLDDILQ